MWKALLSAALLLRIEMSKKSDTRGAKARPARDYWRRWYKVIAFKISRVLEANKAI